jgi:hypothetical protein
MTSDRDLQKERALQSIAEEFAAAAAARSKGNHGMVRVCARRAAGVALTFWTAWFGHGNWGADAISQLRHLQREPGVPDDVRAAAARLTTRVTPDFRSPHASDPVDDSTLIIEWLMRPG